MIDLDRFTADGQDVDLPAGEYTLTQVSSAPGLAPTRGQPPSPSAPPRCAGPTAVTAGRSERLDVPDVPGHHRHDVDSGDPMTCASCELTGPDYPHDSSVDPAELAADVFPTECTAVRWWTATGLVHQLHVTPRHCLKGIGIALVTAAFGVQAAHGRDAMLHGDGRRADDGEAWRARLAPDHQQWFEPWARRLPLMPQGADRVALRGHPQGVGTINPRANVS